MPLTKVSYSMITGSPVNVLDFGADPTGVADSTTAIQNAINAGSFVVLPEGTYKVTSTINLNEGSTLQGEGIGVTNINSTASGFTFEKLNANGTQEIQAPQFSGFTLITTDSGIRLNSATGGFTDNNTSQAYMMRAIINQCEIIGGSTGVGIGFYKCFDSAVNDCYISGFEDGISFGGTDISRIVNNRIRNQTRYGIQDESYGTFGSGTVIFNNDMVSLAVGGLAFVASSNRDITIDSNYMEQATAISAAIIISGGFNATITNNRVEVQAAVAPQWLSVQNELYNLYVVNNQNSGTGWNDANFNSGVGSRYWFNVLQRQKIYHNLNQTAGGIPFCTMPNQGIVVSRAVTPWVITPAVSGLLSVNYGSSVVVRGNAFLIPAIAALGSLVQFYDADNPVTGTVDIYITASTNTAGQTVSIQWLNGTTPIATATQALTTTKTSYKVFSAISVADLNLKVWNPDTVNNDTAFVYEIAVVYA
jgi:hypothetical protein